MANCMQDRQLFARQATPQQRAMAAGTASPLSMGAAITSDEALIQGHHHDHHHHHHRGRREQQRDTAAVKEQHTNPMDMPSKETIERTMLRGGCNASKVISIEVTTTMRDLMQGVTTKLRPEHVESSFRVHPRSGTAAADERTAVERVGDLSSVVVSRVQLISSFLGVPDQPVRATICGLPPKVFPLSVNCGTESGRAARYHHMLMPGAEVPNKPRTLYQRRKFHMLKLAKMYGNMNMSTVSAGITDIARSPEDVDNATYVPHVLVPSKSLVMDIIHLNAEMWNIDPDGFGWALNFRVVPRDFVQFVIGAAEKTISLIKHDNLYSLGLRLSPVSTTAMQDMMEVEKQRKVVITATYRIDYVFSNAQSLEEGWRYTANRA